MRALLAIPSLLVLAPACAVEMASPAGGESPKPVTIYVNVEGEPFHASFGELPDPAINSTPILYESVTVAPWGGDLAAVVSCLGARFASFDVEVTSQEPVAGDYIESVLTAELPTALGALGPVGAATSYDDCRPLHHSISFVIGLEDSPTQACNAVARYAGLSLGLETLVDTRSIMSTNLDAAGGFLDEYMECGTTSSEECRCGGTEQNSHEELLQRVGPQG